ncbi:MAG: glycosyltransferase family 4 protein [Pseudomonadota bacterium]|nr:glycosyltransferase family 4 protein [Pseudomonadota bacterium]
MIAIHYTTVRPAVANHRIFGVDVATTNWLQAWFRYGSVDKFRFLIGEKAEWEEVVAVATDLGIEPSRLVALDRRFLRENKDQFQTVFRPNPDSHGLLWQREQLDKGFNFCGLAHAISGMEAGELLEQYCLAPSEDTDAIICPSRAVQAAIRSFWDLYGAYIERRFGAKFICPVQLPVIPLGIDTAHFEAQVSPPKRRAQRGALGVGEAEVVLLWVGRLSAAIKAHPLAMFQAAERAAETTGASVHLVMVGYFMPKEADAQFRSLAADFCKKAKVTFIASDDRRFPDGLWAAGDVFLSLVDNMQESFGLTPIEAMSTGLPRVLSDWDGYRDSVRQGEDGYLIRTTQPPPGCGEELSRLLLNGREMYGGFLAKTALSVAVDQVMAAEALTVLIRDKDVRAAMAESARMKARAVYDWKAVIGAYEALWQDLADRRETRKPRLGRAAWPSALPQVPDPYTMYKTYPSSVLAEGDMLSVAASMETIKMLWRHEMNVLALDVLAAPEEVTKMIVHIAANKSVSIGALVKAFAAIDAPRLWRTIGWLIKLGILTHKPA